MASPRQTVFIEHLLSGACGVPLQILHNRVRSNPLSPFYRGAYSRFGEAKYLAQGPTAGVLPEKPQAQGS